VTLDPTAAVPAADETWIRQLTQGFGALLGRALSEYDPDAVYAAYFGGNFISEIEYAHDDAWVDPEALAGRRAVEDTPLSMYDMGEPPLVFDASESIFELRPSELPDALAADVPGVTFSEPDSPYPLVRGRDLGELLARHGVDLTDPDLAEGWTVCHARIASDGSLLSALCAATGIGLAERYLVAFAEGLRDDRRLGGVPGPGRDRGRPARRRRGRPRRPEIRRGCQRSLICRPRRASGESAISTGESSAPTAAASSAARSPQCWPR
jgi:hypothetical protein